MTTAPLSAADQPAVKRWRGPIAVEGTPTGDGRVIEPGALTWSATPDDPILLRYAPADVGAHTGAQVVGRIYGIWREDDGRIMAEGDFDLGSEVGREAARQVAEKLTRGVSIDIDEIEFTLTRALPADDTDAQLAAMAAQPEGEKRAIVARRERGTEVMSTTSARIRGVTLVSIPAFAETRIDLIPDDEPFSLAASAYLAAYNWVEDQGGLPPYIDRIRKHLEKKGMTESHAIAVAVNAVKRMCASGDTNFPGRQNVNVGSRAEACAAVARWEAMKTRAKASAGMTQTFSGATAYDPEAALVAGGDHWRFQPRDEDGQWTESAGAARRVFDAIRDATAKLSDLDDDTLERAAAAKHLDLSRREQARSAEEIERAAAEGDWGGLARASETLRRIAQDMPEHLEAQRAAQDELSRRRAAAEVKTPLTPEKPKTDAERLAEDYFKAEKAHRSARVGETTDLEERMAEIMDEAREKGILTDVLESLAERRGGAKPTPPKPERDPRAVNLAEDYLKAEEAHRSGKTTGGLEERMVRIMDDAREQGILKDVLGAIEEGRARRSDDGPLGLPSDQPRADTADSPGAGALRAEAKDAEIDELVSARVANSRALWDTPSDRSRAESYYGGFEETQGLVDKLEDFGASIRNHRERADAARRGLRRDPSDAEVRAELALRLDEIARIERDAEIVRAELNKRRGSAEARVNDPREKLDAETGFDTSKLDVSADRRAALERERSLLEARHRMGEIDDDEFFTERAKIARELKAMADFGKPDFTRVKRTDALAANKVLKSPEARKAFDEYRQAHAAINEAQSSESRQRGFDKLGKAMEKLSDIRSKVQELGGGPDLIAYFEAAQEAAGYTVGELRGWVADDSLPAPFREYLQFEIKRRTGSRGLTASAADVPLDPPAAWFENPGLGGPTPLRIEEDGRVYGHLATWDVCHIGNPGGEGVCTTPPASRSGYSRFHTGTLKTAEGDLISVGHLTMGTGHAGLRLTAAAAASHYDDTGSAVADVRAGEDAYGIWVAGALRPGISDAEIRALRSSPLSGDWRRVDGSLELVAALAVNVPGFPVPRPQGMVASGEVQALAASGMLAPSEIDSEGMSPSDADYLGQLAEAQEAEAKARAVREFAVRRKARALDSRRKLARVTALAASLASRKEN